jgi:hypothetical protein
MAAGGESGRKLTLRLPFQAGTGNPGQTEGGKHYAAFRGMIFLYVDIGTPSLMSRSRLTQQLNRAV